MNKYVVRIFTFLAYFSFSFFAFSAPKLIDSYTPKSGELALAYEMYELDNGLKVLLHPDASTPVVHVHVGYNVGAKNDSNKTTGLAHFFEHLMFEGSEHVKANDHNRIIEEAGGHANAYTAPDMTVYHQTVPNNALEGIFRLEADRMNSIARSITHDKFIAQKGVVTNEKLQTSTNRPYGLVREKLSMAFYPPEHPYYKTVIGWSEDLDDVSIKDLETFARRFYVPNNAVVAVGGDFKTNEVLQWIQTYFGSIPKGPEITPLKPRTVDLKENKWATYEAPNITIPQLHVLYPTVTPSHPDRHALGILSHLLGELQYSTLQQTFKHDARIVGLGSYHAVQQLDCHFGLFIATNPEHTTDFKRVLADIDATIRAFAQAPPSQAELDGVVRAFENSILSGLETTGARIDLLRDTWMDEGDPNKIFKDLEVMAKLTPKDIQRVCQKYLFDQNRLVFSVVPEGQKEWAVHPANVSLERQIVPEPKMAKPLQQETQTIAALKQMPALGPLPQLKLPEIWKGYLGDDITVRGFFDGRLPLVKLKLVIPGGAYPEIKDNAGLAVFVTNMLAKGPEGMDEATFEKELYRLGMSFYVDTNTCDWEIEVNLLQQHFDEGMALLARMLHTPAFRAEDFQKLQQDSLLELEQRVQDPQYLLAQAARTLTYLPSDRKGLSLRGNTQSVKNLTLQAVRDYFADYFHLSYANVYIAGALNQRDALSALGFLQQWPKARKELEDSDVHRKYPAPGIYIVDFPDAEQNIVQATQTLMINNQTAEKFEMELANRPLGGEFTSRLNHQIREVKGYTYGIQSSISNIGPLAVFSVSGQVKPEHTLDTIHEIDTAVDNYVANGPTQNEVDSIKQRYFNSEALRYQSLWSKIDLAEYLYDNKYTQENLEAFAQQVTDFTPEKAQNLSKKWLQKKDRVYVVVGSQQKLLKELASYRLPLYPLQLPAEH